MATGVQVWSTTASQNSTSDTNINWPEGMAPSQVDDSARAMMASVAKFTSDNNGTLVTSGTTAAYTLTTNQVEGALTAGYTVTLQFHATNDTSATLNVDGLGAKPLQAANGTNVSSGLFTVGNIYSFTYSSTGTGQWIAKNAGIAVNSINYPQVQQVSASKLLGNPTGSPANVSEITLGTNLAFSGSTLNAGNNTPVITVITSTATVTWQSTTQGGNFPLYLKVRMVGGGGGGGAQATNAGSNGTDTSFSTWTAIHGSGGTASNTLGGAGGSGGVNGTGTLITRVSGQAGQTGYSGTATNIVLPGGLGGNSVFGGGGAGGASGNSTGGSAQSNTGSGGQGGGASNTGAGSGGGAGEYVEFIVTSPSTSYAVQVGPGGGGGAAGVAGGGSGAAGRIEVIAYWQ